MAPNLDFESQSFNLFSINEEFQNNEISSLDAKYYVPGEGKDQLKSLQLNSFSVFHLNIRSMKKYFEAFHDFIEFSNFKFSATCLSKIWLQRHEISDVNFELPGYYSFHLTR